MVVVVVAPIPSPSVSSAERLGRVRDLDGAVYGHSRSSTEQGVRLGPPPQSAARPRILGIRPAVVARRCVSTRAWWLGGIDPPSDDQLEVERPEILAMPTEAGKRKLAAN